MVAPQPDIYGAQTLPVMGILAPREWAEQTRHQVARSSPSGQAEGLNHRKLF